MSFGIWHAPGAAASEHVVGLGMPEHEGDDRRETQRLPNEAVEGRDVGRSGPGRRVDIRAPQDLGEGVHHGLRGGLDGADQETADVDDDPGPSRSRPQPASAAEAGG